MELNQVTLAVRDVRRSVGFYERLGFKRIVDAPHYARFECRPGGPSFSVHRSEAGVSDSSVVIYFECDDLDKQIEELRQAGIFQWKPTLRSLRPGETCSPCGMSPFAPILTASRGSSAS